MALSPTCPICHGADVVAKATLVPDHGTDTYRAMSCRDCGVVFSDPMPDLSLQDLQEVYGSGYIDSQSVMSSSPASLDVFRKATHRQMVIVERYVKPGVALNVGATSEAIGILAERGWDLRLVEASAYSAERARANWGFDVTTSRIEDFECPPSTLDFVKLGHVIEHLAEPREVLRRLAAMLRTGGGILVDTDNAHGLRSRIETSVRAVLGEDLSANLVRRLTGKNFRKRYGTLGPPVHLYAFTQASLACLLEESGFEIVEQWKPAYGDRTWFPITSDVGATTAERAMLNFCRIGAWLGAGDVVAALAVKR